MSLGKIARDPFREKRVVPIDGERNPRPRDPAALAAALRSVVPGGAEITGVVPLTTGFSNETYRIEGPDLILRLPPVAGAMLDGHDVVAQARIYAALGEVAGAPPVPRIVAIGEDAGALGVPFFVMERVAGASIDDLVTPAWLTEGEDALRARVCRDWIAAFAGLARLPAPAVLGPATSPEDDARRWRAFAQAADSPVLATLFDRLLKVPAPRSGPPAIVHGDPKLSNLMWDDGVVSAMLDWEMSIHGEPLADLGYMLYFFESPYNRAARAQKLPGMLNADEAIALWSRITGRPTEGLIWHRIAQLGKIAAIIAEGTTMYETGRSRDPKLAQFRATLDYYVGVMGRMVDGAGL